MRPVLSRVLVGLQIALLLAMSLAPAALAATIQTDLWVYSNGDTVTVTGVEFGPNEIVDLVTTDNVGTVVDVGTAESDAAGGVTYQFVLNVTLSGIYDVVATGRDSGLSATTQFDPPGLTITNGNPNTASRPWFRTVSGGFDVTVSGGYSCTGTCSTTGNVVVAITGVAGSSRNATKTASTWTVTFPFRTSPSGAQLAIPADGTYTVTVSMSATTTNGGTDSATASSTGHFGVDNTLPTSAVTAATAGGNLSTSGTASDATSGLQSLLVEVHETLCAGTVLASDTVGVSGGTWSKNFTAAAVTAPGTYCVTSKATDNAGNVQTTLGSKTYSVTAPPAVTVTSPLDGATNVDLNGDVVVTFSEPVTVTTSPTWLTLSCSTSGTHAGATSGNGTSTLTFNPTVDFASGETCTATVQKNQVTSVATSLTLAANATFSFTVKTIVTNTPPVVAVLGPTNGSSYAKGSVPAASCSVVDAEDLNESATPVLGPITGPDAANGIGTRTVTCSYTDGGGLSDSDSVTYTITDGTAPTISYVVTPTAPDGSNDWYRSNVTLVWTVTEGDSTSTLVTTGCADQALTADQDATDYSCSATSDGGSAGPVTVSIKIDKTAPSAGASQSPAANANGWNNTDVTVTFTGSDDLSGIATCSAPDIRSSEGANQSSSGTCTDKAGNTSATATVSGINIDKTAPTANAGRTPVANGSGWNNSDVTVTFDGADGLSGIDFCSSAATVFTEGANQSRSGTCTDKAGNTSATATVGGINIDKTAPSASGSASPAANANGWNNTDVTVAFNGSDGLSGVDFCTAPHVLSSEGAGQSSSGTCTDKAGNTSATATVNGVNIDKTAPDASASRTPAANANGWNNSDVTVSYSGSDGLSGIASCDTDDVLSTEGANQSASGTCTDKAGNTSDPASITGIKIDKTAPTATAAASPAPNVNGWRNSAVTVTFTGEDALSGVESCDDPVLLSSEGADQSASGDCTDLAGNTSTSATADNIDIDLTNPLVSLVGGPADGGSYYFGFVPAAPTCTASDALSGLDGSCSVSGYSAAVGSHTVTASATDKAGNSASAAHAYVVDNWTLKGFYAPVDMNGVYNVVKGGSTVPLKFEVFAGPTELTATAYVKSFTQTKIACDGSATFDEIEVTSTGGTSLRYDTTAGQYIQNWQTPKTAGACYKVTMTTQDNSLLTALFRLK